MKFNILTLFPESLEPYLNTSILGRAQEKKLAEFNLVNVRDFAEDNHKSVDDTPYGGGPGMVLKIEPIAKALDSIKSQITNHESRVIILSARGEQFTQKKASEYAQLDNLILISGRYEGIDQRVADNLADEEISIGPYVLAGGEIPALTVIEATSRLIPGVLGNEESLAEESHSHLSDVSGQLSAEYPQYTKPEDYNGWTVPEVLLSGNHEAIKKWRQKMVK